jgi:cation:H+ antiporter
MYQFFNQLIGTQLGLIILFAVTAAVVVLSGIRLSIYGDALGDRTGLGSGLVGLIFLAAVTSLPELVVSLTSVIQCTDPSQGADLATGNMLGSNVFNLLILALLALLFRSKFKPDKMDNPHTDSTIYGLIMLGIFSLCFITSSFNGNVLPLLSCGLATLLLPITYAFILRREHQQQIRTPEEDHLPAETKLAQLPALSFYSALSGLCLLIIGGGIVLSILGSRMALPPEQGGFGLEASLIGTVFLAISTSLPELVISIASVRMGFVDMAVGNVLGSNMFNLLIIFAADIALRGKNLLTYASAKNWTSVGLILLLTLLAGLLLRTKTRKSTAITAGVMILTYGCAMRFFA